MSGALIEQTLELWSGELCTIKAQIRSLFGHASVAASAAAFLDRLLGPERRKTGWMRAEAAGDPGPWRQQAVLGRSRWDADALRDLVRDYALATLVRWSVQEIRRLANRLAQRRIEPAFVIAWSVWRRCHQAMARQAHLKRTLQL